MALSLPGCSSESSDASVKKGSQPPTSQRGSPFLSFASGPSGQLWVGIMAVDSTENLGPLWPWPWGAREFTGLACELQVTGVSCLTHEFQQWAETRYVLNKRFLYELRLKSALLARVAVICIGMGWASIQSSCWSVS